MKKNLFMSLLLASAALLGSCDGNLSGGGDGTEGGSFEGGGISKSYKYATDYYAYGTDTEGVYSHILLFTNIPYTPDDDLAEGEKLDAFMVYYLSDSEELGTSTMSWADYWTDGDLNIFEHIPCFVGMNAFGETGTAQGETTDDYSYDLDIPNAGNVKVNVVRNGDSYEIVVKDIPFEEYDDDYNPVSKFKGNFSFRGQVKSVDLKSFGS